MSDERPRDSSLIPQPSSLINEPKPRVVGVNNDRATDLKAPEQDSVHQRLLDLLLDQPGHGASPECAVVAVLGQPCASGLTKVERDVLRRELRSQLVDELVDHALDDLEAQRIEGDPGVEP